MLYGESIFIYSRVIYFVYISSLLLSNTVFDVSFIIIIGLYLGNTKLIKGGVYMISDWGKVNSNLKWLIQADENPYFDLMSFCNNKGLNYRDIIGFINIGKSISSGDLNLSKELKEDLKTNERLAKQLEMITV